MMDRQELLVHDSSAIRHRTKLTCMHDNLADLARNGQVYKQILCLAIVQVDLAQGSQ